MTGSKKVQTVPLVIYGPGNQRTVIGEAVVDIDGPYFSVEGKITDPKFSINNGLSMMSVRHDSVAIARNAHARERSKEAHPSNHKPGPDRW